MKYPPSRTRGLRPMKALEAGEGSRTYRVRAPDAVHEWLSGMSAEERGQMLVQAHQLDLGREHPPREWPEAVRERMEQLEARFRPPAMKPLSEAPAQALAQAERLTVGKQLADLKAHHEPVVRALQAGGTLTRAPGGVWRLVGGGEAGRTLKAETVRVLLERGALAYAVDQG